MEKEREFIKNTIADYAEEVFIIHGLDIDLYEDTLNVEEIEYQPRDGFIPFTEGGYSANTFIRGYELYNIVTPYTDLDKRIEQVIDFEKEISEEEGTDFEDSLWESEYNAMLYLQIQVYEQSNSRGLFYPYHHSCYVKLAMNFEYPYFREYMPAWAGGGCNEWKLESEFAFDNFDEFVTRLPKHIQHIAKQVNNPKEVQNA